MLAEQILEPEMLFAMEILTAFDDGSGSNWLEIGERQILDET